MAEHISRRVFLRSAGAAAAALALPRFAWGDVQAGGERSNVLFIAVDDLNDWIGCLGGHPDTRTPNLDRLAARGVLFEQAHCSAPLCNPSRASLMTGIRPSSSGVYTNTQPWRPAMPDAVTLPQHFMAHGYEVMGSGKTFHDAFPDPPSWQRYWPGLQRQRPPDPMPPKRPLNGIPNAAQFDWGPIDAKDQDMGDWQVADWVRGELAKKHAKPFFLACGFFRPHLPWYVPGKYFDMFPLDKVTLPVVKKDDLSDVPPIGRQFANAGGDHARVIKTDNWSRAVQGYLASIAFSDACLGRVLEALDASEHAKNTVVVLWGDHGWHLGEKLHWRKFTLWEEATRCPLMMVAPGVTKPGGVCPRPVSLLDVYPTLADLCRLKPNAALEGQSLVPLLKDPAAPWERPAVTTYLRGNHSVRSERWRYIRYHDGSEELYDHGSDANEWTNLAGDSKYDPVKADLARWLPKTNAPDGGGRQ